MKRARWQVLVACELLFGAALGGVLTVGAPRPKSADYHLLKKVVLGGEGG